MALTRSAALLLVSFVALTACDRFRHAKYERSPWGGSEGGYGALASTDASDSDASADTECSRTGTCPGGGGVVFVGGGSGVAGGGDAGAAVGCGLTFEEPSCDACMQTSCCLAESACASDGVCSGIGDCMTACGSSDSCVAACETAYEANAAARQLGACLASWCASTCD